MARDSGHFTVGQLLLIIAILGTICGIVASFASSPSPGLLAWALATYVMPVLLVVLGQLLFSIRLGHPRSASRGTAEAEPAHPDPAKKLERSSRSLH